MKPSRVLILIALTISAFCSGAANCRELNYLAPSTATPPNEYYFTKVLSAALAKSDNPYNLVPIAGNMQQKRLMALLDQGQFDVLWTMTSSSREMQAKPVRVPLTMGLFGYRQVVMKSENKAAFDGLSSKEQLKSRLCAQGRHWPDLQILQGNGFRVAAADGIRDIYRLIDQGFVDYTARSVLEVEHELVRFQSLGVASVREYLVYYPTAMYFFVRDDDTQLYEDLAYGLEQMAQSGELLSILGSHPQYKSAVDWIRSSPPAIWRIDNPLLPAETPVDKKQYWLSASN